MKSSISRWVFGSLANRLFSRPAHVCFCTLAIHPPYRERARLLLGDVPGVPWIVLTDEPDDFADLPVRAIRHEPTGPMASDFLTRLPPTGQGRGRPAYHDKRFVVQAALGEFDSAIFVDADSRITSLPDLPRFRPGIAVVRDLRTTIADHLTRYGQARLPAFEQLALHLMGNADVLKSARWCSEALFVVTKDGNEARFFEAWARAAQFLHASDVFTGEGGAIGLAAAYAGWTIDYKRLSKLAAATQHEGCGPKVESSQPTL
jgi:hypothetical protein